MNKQQKQPDTVVLYILKCYCGKNKKRWKLITPYYNVVNAFVSQHFVECVAGLKYKNVY